MLKHIVSATVFAASLTGVALAQTAGGAGARMEKAANAPQASGMIAPAFLSIQDQSQYMAKSLLGVSVTASDGKKVGTVKDVILDTSGRAAGFVVSHGGVLGVGDKEVGVPFQRVKIRTTDDGEKKVLRLSMSLADFDAAPEFKDIKAQNEERAKATEKMKDGGGAAR